MILVLNCGSQSIKWKLFECKRNSGSGLKLKKQGEANVFDVKNYEKTLIKELKKVINYKKDVKVIGHRIVHGGKKFREPTLITEENLKELKRFNKLAPLHNPFNVLGVGIAKKIFPNVKQIAVFDTSFYKDLPEKASVYALPGYIKKEFGFQRFGFHGISHKFAAKEASKKVKKPFKKLKIITCHLGGGSSITAVKNGKAIDTSMGFTPMAGLLMMTRAGDIDAGIVLQLVERFSVEKTDEILNFESGIKAICGEKEMLKVLEKARRGDKKAKLALNIFVYKIRKYIGSYYAVLNGCDLLVFTGTIGYGSLKIRNMVCKNLNILKNTKVLSIKTNEELAIAEEALKCINK